MTRSIRLRLSRRKGFDLQAASLAANGLPAIVVARPGPWGNPFVVGIDGTREHCVEMYRAIIGLGGMCVTSKAPIERQRAALDHIARHAESLRGHNVACWCSLDGPCHGDVLLEIANAELNRAREESRQ